MAEEARPKRISEETLIPPPLLFLDAAVGGIRSRDCDLEGVAEAELETEEAPSVDDPGERFCCGRYRAGLPPDHVASCALIRRRYTPAPAAIPKDGCGVDGGCEPGPLPRAVELALLPMGLGGIGR